MTNAERQAKWRDKNRELFNLRRRNARKAADKVGSEVATLGVNPKSDPILPVPVLAEPSCAPESCEGGEARESTPVTQPRMDIYEHNRVAVSDSRGGQRPTIAELRELVEKERLKPPPQQPTMPLVYRNDFGGIITKGQWEKLQEKKRQAKEGGYSLDEYSQ